MQDFHQQYNDKLGKSSSSHLLAREVFHPQCQKILCHNPQYPWTKKKTNNPRKSKLEHLFRHLPSGDVCWDGYKLACDFQDFPFWREKAVENPTSNILVLHSWLWFDWLGIPQTKFQIATRTRPNKKTRKKLGRPNDIYIYMYVYIYICFFTRILNSLWVSEGPYLSTTFRMFPQWHHWPME